MEESTKQNTRNKIDIKNFSVHSFSLSYDDEHKDYIENSSKVVNSYLVNTPINTSETEISPGNFFCNKRDMAGLVLDNFQSRTDLLTNSENDPKQVQNISEETLVHPTKDNDLSNSSVNEESEISHTCKRKCDGENDVTSNIKKKTTDDKKIASLRKNIRDVMDENFLDTNTLAAQREESERLARVQEQQKLIRDYQRQRAANRQNIRTRDRILSLLQTNSSLTKTSTDDFDNKTETATFSTNVSENISTVNAYLVNGVAQEVSLQQSSVIHSKRNILEEENITTNIVPLSSPIVSSDPLDKDKNKSDLDEIVTIVDSSSENDCILLSDDPEEEEEETEDDPQNSGLHVKDLYNVPDANGNVVVNIGHPKGEPDIFIAPQIARTIKPHQIGGVRFLYDNIIESIHRFNSSTGFGCILAHSMGLGKTLQVVCFCDIFLRHTESKTVLCVMPINTIQNWAAEFNIWTPKASENNEKIRPRTFNVFILNDQQKTLCARSKIIFQWAEEGGVLLMGYELFRLLALKLVTPKKKKNKSCSSESVETRSHKKLVEKIHMALVTPGPDLVICDEGHRIKNSHAGISVALKQIRTRRRIVLTGYPLQNNLLEYWCMVDFVRPNYLGTKTEFSNMFERPIQNGQCIDSTPEDIKLMRYRAHVLHSLLVGFVQRRSHIVLQNSLPSKLEYVLLTKMTSFQRKLYETFMNDVVRTKTVPNPLKAFAVCCKIWNHPDVLYNFLKKKDNDLDLEIEESETPDSVPKFEKSTNNNKNTQEILTNKSPQETSETNQGEIATKDKMKENLKLSKNLESQMINPQDSLYANQQYLDIYNRSNCYQNSSIESGFNDEMTGSNFWQDTSAPIDYASTTPTNILTSISADYNGTVFNETSNQESQIVEKKSSQIVDLDTKEIKTVETNIDYVDTKKFSGFPYTSSHIDTLKYSDKEKVETNVGAKLEKESLKNKGDDGIPYDWAFELMKDYEPENIENSPKIKLLFFILDESLRIGDRILLFSQSLLTLNLIEKFLQTHRMPGSINCWAKNSTYFRLDGSTTSLEREKLVNEFNVNKNIHLFLISTRAGSLGINLVGANRVIVFDASWNPCHDTQAVYRIYRYGQTKPCFVYRIVMDNCLEKKIYDRQVKKQGMSNRVVDECNPDPYLSMKDVTNLCFDYEEDKKTEYNKSVEQYDDVVMQKISDLHRDILSKEPFHHESLLIDRKEKKLSQAEKRLAQRSYEMEKKATTKQTFSYASNKVHCRFLKPDTIMFNKLLTPLRTPPNSTKSQHLKPTSARWIPAEVWQRQGMTAQEMVLPLDVVIPTHSNEKSNIVLKAGQKVMVLKSPKGIYMQLENGKIIAIRASNKTNQEKPKDKVELIDITSDANNSKENKNMSEKHISEEPLVVEKDNSNQNKKIKDENGQLSKHTCANNASTDDVIIINDSLTTKEDSSRKANLTIDLKASQSSSKTKETQFFGTNDKLCSIATASNNMSMNCDTQYPNNANFSKTSPRTNSHEISKYVHRQTCNASRNPTEMCFLQNRNLQDKSPESQRYPYLTAAQQKDENLNYIRSNNDLTKRPENYISHYSVGRHNSRQDYYEAPGNLFQTYKGQRDLSQNEASVNDPCLQTPTESINEVVRNCTMPERTHLQLANSEYRPNFLNPTPNLFKQDKFTNKTGGNKSATFVQPNGTRENFHHKEIQSSFNPTQEEYIATGNLHGESLQQQMMENNPVTAPYMVGGEGMHNQYLDTWLENPTINSIYDPQPHYGGDYSYVSQYRPHYNRVGFMSPQEHRLPHRYYMRWSPMSSDHASAFEPQSSISNHSQYSSQGNQWQRQQ